MRRTSLIPFLLCPCLLGGCYGAKVLRQPVTVEESARDLEAMRQQLAAVEARLGELEKRSSEQAEMLRGLRAETTSRFSDMDTRLSTIDSRLRDTFGQRETFSRPNPSFWNASPGAPRSADQGGTGTSLGSPADSGASDLPARVDSSVAPGGEVVVPDGSISESDAKRLYDQAYKDMTRGNYSLALVGFGEFLRHSPGSDLADNAQYWVGESHYAQRDYNMAIQEFLKVQETYPRGDKVPAALLKAGFSFLALDDRASARRYLNQVVEQFPNSEEAVSARNKLRSAF